MSDPIDPTRTADLPAAGDTRPPPADAPTRVAPDTDPARPGTPPAAAPAVPGYEVLGELGRGGMGTVYTARQRPLNRLVALKVVLAADRRDDKARIRFLAEAEAVAAIKHPNVVQVYEYGDHAGCPFLALELVDGGTLADRLAAAGKFPPAGAAALLAPVARGVQAAHDQGIVHRDLKPANILLQAAAGGPRAADADTVTHSALAGPPAAWVPKVTDFGLAKRGGGTDLTNTRAVMGTPSYMAPEQAAGGSKFVGPAADVYALGVILYECLTGAKPFEADDAWAVLHKVMADDPPPPRAKVPGLPRDLELICLKCLEKDPARRYPTAAALADDLDRFLGGRPVHARPVTAAERAWRWGRRNPVLAVALGGFLAAVVATAAALYDGYRQAVALADTERQLRAQESAAKDEADRLRRQAELARVATAAEAARANQVSDFLSGMFQASDPLNVFGDDILPPSWETQRRKTAEDFLRDATARFTTELADQPLARAKLLAAVGNSFRNLGLFQDAEPLLRDALALRQEQLPADHPDVAAGEYDLGKLFLDTGDFPAAAERFRAARAIQERAGADEKTILNTRMFEGWALGMLGVAAAEPILRDGLAARERLYGKYHRQTMIIRMGLAAYLIDTGRAAEAAHLIPDIIAGLNAQPESQVRKLAQVTVDFQVGVAFRAEAGGREFFLRRAEQALRDSLAGGVAALPEDHMYLSLIRHELAFALVLRGRGDEADRLFEQCLASVRKTAGLAHPKVLVLLGNYVVRLGRTGRLEAARGLFDEVDRAGVERFGPSSHWRALLLLSRAEFEAEYGDTAAAVAHAAAAAALADAGKLVPTRPAALALADAARELGRRPRAAAGPAADALYAHARRVAAAVFGDPSPELAGLILTEGDGRFATGDRAAGAALVLRAEALTAALPKPPPAADRNALFNTRGWVEMGRGEWAAAAEYFRKALDLSRRFADPKDRQDDATGLAAALVGLGQSGDAADALDEAKRAADARPQATPAATARAAAAAAAGKLAAGDAPGHRAAVQALAKRFTAAGPADPVGEVGRAAGLAPDGCGLDLAALARRMDAALAAHPSARAGHRALALVRMRAGAAPPEVNTLLTRAPGVVIPTDHLIYGMSLAAAGRMDDARVQLWKAEALRPRPSAADPFAFAGSHWLDRLEAQVLAAELAGKLPPAPPPVRGPMPRPAGPDS